MLEPQDGPIQSYREDISRPLVAPFDSGFGVFWADREHDGTQTCCDQRECVYELFGAVLNGEGEIIVGPLRLTTDAIPEPPPVAATCEDR